MGGRPWQSKGCINCRHRKIKCDEGKPECARCTKRGLKCQGTDNYSHFIGAPSINESNKKAERIVIRHCQATTSARIAILPARVSSKQAMRVQMFASFQQQTFPAQQLPSINGYQSFLISSIGNLSQKSQMVDKAVSALACLFLGKTNHEPPIFYHGLQLYNSAIRDMSRLIQCSKFHNDLLYTTYLFQEIQILYCPNGLTAWGTHIAGMDALLKQYRTKGQNDPIIDAIYSHQHKLNIFNTSTGMNLLESEYEYLMEPTNGDPLLEIIQSAVTIGKLQSMLDTVDYTSLTACQDILHRCYEARECLLRLRTDGLLGEDPSDNECAANYFQPINEAVPSSTLLFGPPYHFSSSDHVALYMMFWGVQMLFQRLIYRARSIFQLHTDITRSGFQEDLSHSYFFENQEISLPGVYANRIARAVPYCLQESLKNTCHRPILFSLSGVSAYCVEIGDRRKFDWCQEVFKHTEARGTGTSAHLFALANSRWERRQEMGRNQFVCLSLRSQTYNSLCNVMPPALPKACSGIGGTSAYHSDGPIVAEIFE